MNRLVLSSRKVLAPLTAAHYGWLAVCVLLLTIYGSIIPLQFKPLDLSEAVSQFARITVWDPADLEARGDWVVSMVLFATLSFLLLGAFGVDRPRIASALFALVTVPVCGVFSVGMEFAQLYFPPRTVSLNDIAVESLGAVLGATLWLAAGQRATEWLRRLTTITGLEGLAGRLLPAYVFFVLAIQLMPLAVLNLKRNRGTKNEPRKLG